MIIVTDLHDYFGAFCLESYNLRRCHLFRYRFFAAIYSYILLSVYCPTMTSTADDHTDTPGFCPPLCPQPAVPLPSGFEHAPCSTEEEIRTPPNISDNNTKQTLQDDNDNDNMFYFLLIYISRKLISICQDIYFPTDQQEKGASEAQLINDAPFFTITISYTLTGETYLPSSI